MLFLLVANSPSRRSNRDHLLKDTPEKSQSEVIIFRGPSSSSRTSKSKLKQEVINETVNADESFTSTSFVDTPRHLYGNHVKFILLLMNCNKLKFEFSEMPTDAMQTTILDAFSFMHQ